MIKLISRTLTAAGLALFFAAVVHAQVSLTSGGYTEDFNSIPGFSAYGIKTWTDNSTLTGWYSRTEGTAGQYYLATNANNQSPNQFPATPTSILALRRNSSNAALGAVSNNTYSGVFGAQFVNNTGSAINALTVSYTGQQWSWSDTGANTLQFTYSLDASSLSDGVWSDVNQLDFTALYSGNTVQAQGLLGDGDEILVDNSYETKGSGEAGGPGAPNYVEISYTITGLSIDEGESFWLRWADDFSGSGVGQALGIDNLSVTAVPEPASLAAAMALAALGVAAIRRRRSRA